jgi:diguanylate cyclase (GGDEF)-like protein
MEIRLYFQMLQRGWWLIASAALAAISISLALSYVTVPQYQSSARLIISPNYTATTGNADVVRSLDTLDRQSTVSTYAEVLGSSRMLDETLSALQLKSVDLKDYTRTAVVLPSSSVIELTVTGPNPTVVAQLTNAISRQAIAYTRDMNQVYKVDFLDSATTPTEPISPQPLRDASLALVLGIAIGAVLAILREQIQTPIEALRTRGQMDQSSAAFNRRHFQRDLEETQARSRGNIGLALIHLEGINGLIDSLPPRVTQRLLQNITAKLRKELRGNDRIGRWGDLQFAVLLPSTPIQAAERTLDRIRIALSETIQLEQINAPVVLEPFVAVVVSQDQESPQSVVERAEIALDQARQKHFAGADDLSRLNRL